MPTIRLRADSPRSSFAAAKFGVARMGHGETREVDTATAAAVVERYPEVFEVVTSAAASPTANRAVKSPTKKATKPRKSRAKKVTT